MLSISREKQLAYVLLQMGIKQDVSGYKYLKHAISMYMDDDTVSFTQKVYPEIAEKFSIAPHSVERAMRHAIETAFSVAPIEVLTAVFGNTINYNSGKVTCSHFVAAVAEKMRFLYVPTEYSDISTLIVKDPIEKMIAEVGA